jgi:hypothetical protein
VTFQRFTRRAWGWVGGFPQTSLFRAWGPCLAPGLWLVGDSIFPSQSVPAVALAGRYTFVIGEKEKFGGDLAFPFKMRSYWEPVEVPAAEPAPEPAPVRSPCGGR